MCKSPYDLPKRTRGGLPLMVGINKYDMRYVYTIEYDGPNAQIHGIDQEFTLDDSLTSCCLILHGEKSGIYQEWYNTGDIKFQVNYNQDGKVGPCQSWHNIGILNYKIHMNKNKANGFGSAWKYKNVVGAITPYLYTQMYYINHKLSGLVQEFHDNRQIASESNKVDGVTYGKYKRWASDGHLHDITCMYNGKQNGLYLSYDKDGNIGDCMYYHDNEIIGIKQCFIKGNRVLEYNMDVIFQNTDSEEDSEEDSENETKQDENNEMEDVTETF
jgi:antitoxin component YwqK of YwqJK toxin-antitoxin module